jgi:hypothetical protein
MARIPRLLEAKNKLYSEAPRAPARGICGKAKRNSAVATRLRPTGYAAVASPFYRAEALAKGDPPRASTRGILAKAREGRETISGESEE